MGSLTGEELAAQLLERSKQELAAMRARGETEEKIQMRRDEDEKKRKRLERFSSTEPVAKVARIVKFTGSTSTNEAKVTAKGLKVSQGKLQVKEELGHEATQVKEAAARVRKLCK